MTKDLINRREFVGATLAATAAALHSQAAGSSGQAARRTKPGMKLGLYTITFLGAWYRGDALPLEEIIKRAKKYGYDGVEIDGKRPHGNPLDMPKSRCRELLNIADGEGIEIYGVAANNDFSSPIVEQREAQILYVHELIRVASDLHAKSVRVFLAWPGVTEHEKLASYEISRPLWETAHKGSTREQTWDWCRAGLVECSRYAGDAGVTLALQNHEPVIRDHQDVLKMVREVNSPHLKVSLDAPIMPVKTAEYIRQAALDVGPLQALSHFGGEYTRGADGKVKGEAFYPPFVRAMHEIGYQGYLGYELCHPLPKVNGQTVGVEYADQNAQMAAEFMHDVIVSQTT
jgi:protein FrlC